MSDLTAYARKLGDLLSKGWFASRDNKRLAAKKLVEFAQDLEHQADLIGEREHLLSLEVARNDRLEGRLHHLRLIETRMEIAIEEFNSTARRAKEPYTAAAIILSPAQHERFRHSRYAGLPILVAAGITGPLIVSAKALDGISRQAPELLLRAA